jgi:membrane protein YdbS with pleckstrin-like domain
MDAGFTPLDGRARTLFHLQAAWTWFAFWVPTCAIGLGVLLAIGPPLGVRSPFPLAAGLAGGVLFLQGLRAVWWPALATGRWGYRLEPEVLLVRRGVWFRTVVAIPRSRIQHVDLRQGPLEQLVGLTRLQVHTASGLGPDGTIPGLDPEIAEALRRALVAGHKGSDGV